MLCDLVRAKIQSNLHSHTIIAEDYIYIYIYIYIKLFCIRTIIGLLLSLSAHNNSSIKNVIINIVSSIK
jgi:hypothetical protein